MVRVELWRNKADGSLLGFVARGHSDFAKRGQDIVCAGVSAMTMCAVLGLQARLGLDVTVDDQTDGYLLCRLPDNVAPPLWERAQDLLETMTLGLRQLAEDYPGHVRVEEVAE